MEQVYVISGDKILDTKHKRYSSVDVYMMHKSN